MKKTAVIVLIGDIVGSRDLDERSQIQRKLKRIFTLIKRKRSFLLSPYTITLGDEFQAVYGRAEYLFVDILNILSSIYPVKARFAIGIGGLKTPINRA
jgi:hypothetical protein